MDHVNAPFALVQREAALNWFAQSDVRAVRGGDELAPQLLASRGRGEARERRGETCFGRSPRTRASLPKGTSQNPEEERFHAFYTECRAQFLATSEDAPS